VAGVLCGLSPLTRRCSARRWGANSASALEGSFDVVVRNVPSLIKALRETLGDKPGY
jgi:hypothetical protein